MLELKFSHLKYAKVLDIGGLPLRPCEHTYLLDCCVMNELDEDFIEYDTKWYPLGNCLEKCAQHTELGPGPYLVLFLKTVTEGYEKWGGMPHYWTTIRTLSHCEWWMPLQLPQKYCNAIGKKVRIVYSGDENEEAIKQPEPNFLLRPIIKDISEKEARGKG